MTRTIRSGDQPFGRVHPPLGDADLAIVNVETAIATTGTPAEKDYTFRSPPAFARQIAAAGIDAVSLANNHSLDYGRTALEETIAHLQSAGVTPIGAGADLTRALAPAEFKVGGQRVAIFGASQIIPSPTWLATSTRSGIVSAGKHVIDARTERLLDAVREARSTHDVVLVVLHWGIEGEACPSAVQRRLGRLLREAGASAVLGAHPHVLQPVIADETGLVAYSMGNFIWDPRGGETADTGVLELVFDGAQLIEHRVYPHRLDGNGWAAAVDPEGAAGRRILARVERRCPA